MNQSNTPTEREGQKRPADRIATGEAEEEYEAEPDKDAAAAQLGRKGGAARAKNRTPEERAEIVRNAANGRWKNSRDHCITKSTLP